MKGLVLAGGRSSRMQVEKALLEREGQPLFTRAIQALTPVCESVFVSARQDSLFLNALQVPALFDDVQNIGPAAALLRAHREDPLADWFCLAVDFPNITPEDIACLADRHAKNEAAEITCFVHDDETPEPLFSIWSPIALARLRSNVKTGFQGPLHTLKECEVQMIRARSPRLLFNTNTPQQWSESLT